MEASGVSFLIRAKQQVRIVEGAGVAGRIGTASKSWQWDRQPGSPCPDHGLSVVSGCPERT